MVSTDWRLDGIQISTCNCDFSCPCQFNALPTHGDCRAAVAVRINKGHFGSTALDGVQFAALLAWPGPIHEGRGEAQLIVDADADDDQVEAIQAIFHGRETEPGATIFNVFTNVIDNYHEMQRKHIDFDVDLEARTAHFAIPGIIEGRAEPIKNPVTGEPHRVRVTIPHGFEYHEAEYASSDVATEDESRIPLQWKESHAHIAHLDWLPSGPVHA